MLRFGLLCFAIIVLVGQTEAQDGNFEECFLGIRPKSMRRAHGQFKRDCAADLETAELTGKKLRMSVAFKKCVVEKYGWLTNDALDTEKLKATVEGYMGYSDLSDAQKAAVRDSYSTCITACATESWAWLKMMRCMANACAAV